MSASDDFEAKLGKLVGSIIGLLVRLAWIVFVGWSLHQINGRLEVLEAVCRMATEVRR